MTHLPLDSGKFTLRFLVHLPFFIFLFLSDMLLHMVADQVAGMVADMGAGMVADKVADMVVVMAADKKKYDCSCPTRPLSV